MAAFVQLLCMCDNLKAVNPQNFIHDISVFYLLTVFFIFQVLVLRYHCFVLCYDINFYFHFSPYPRKLNDNEKLWIYGST